MHTHTHAHTHTHTNIHTLYYTLDICMILYQFVIVHYYQVLSKSVADGFKTMRELKVTTTETSETEKFCRIFNKFFDIFNTRSLNEGRVKKNPDLYPFKEDDSRLKVHFIVIKLIQKAHDKYAVAERNTFNLFK